MPKPKPIQIELVSSNITLEDLRADVKAHGQRDDRPRKLPIDDIHVADQVFQPRMTQYNLAASLDHVKTLVSDLRAQKKPFDAVTVIPIGQRFFVIDGHHRLSAYRAAGWNKDIPVAVRPISLDEARKVALAMNLKGKLSLTMEDKQENAWRLTKSGETKQRTSDLTLVSTSNIGNMRKLLARLKAADHDVDNMTWRQARRADKAPDNDFDRDAWVNEEAKSLSEKLLKSAGTKLVDNPEVLAEAIRMISPRLVTALISEWIDEAYEYVEEHREAIEEEKRIEAELDIT